MASRRSRERRLAAERLLAERGLLRGPRRILSGRRPALDGEVVVHELRPALVELGGIFPAFGRFLSLRADFLRSIDCLRLEEIEAEAVASPLEAVDRRLAESLGRRREEVFTTFDATPFEVRWLDQAHHARLDGGKRVVVRVIHPDRRPGLERELDALDVLKGALTGPGFSTAEHFEQLIADFRRILAQRLDLGRHARALQTLKGDARNSDLLVVPEVYPDLSADNVLTTQWLPGTTVDEMAGLSGLQEVDANDLARRVGLIWLQMALVGPTFPIEADITELPDGRLAVTGGLFATLPEASRVRLWNYLRATSEHYPDRAAANLMGELTKARPDAIEGELRTRIRQAVPFRDGSWSTTGESLGEYALLHWHLLRRAGFRARPRLDDFFQGLFWAARSARRFAPQADPLGEALRDLEWIAGWNQLRQLASPRQMGATAESYLSNMAELPQKLDRILTIATDEGGLRQPATPPKPRRREGNATAVVICLGLMMAAWVLLSDPWRMLGAALGLAEPWIEGLTAAVFLALGVLLLKAVSGKR